MKIIVGVVLTMIVRIMVFSGVLDAREVAVSWVRAAQLPKYSRGIRTPRDQEEFAGAFMNAPAAWVAGPAIREELEAELLRTLHVLTARG